jgi:hypothetical protein
MMNPDNGEATTWAEKADLASSILGFRKRAADTLDSVLQTAIKHNQDMVPQVFTTAGGREALVVLVIGDEKVRETLNKLGFNETQ